MRNKKLFQRTKASNQEFRILADEDLDYVSGGTDSLESEESSEETPEVQSDSSDSGSSEEKLEDLASQAVAAAEAPVESAPVDTTTVDAQINAIQSSAGSNTNEAQTNVADSVLNSYTEGITDRNQSEDSTVSIDMGTQANQTVKLEMTDMRESALGITTLDVTNRTSATASQKVIDNVLQRALNQEASIGEIMNRLEFTSSNLTTASENLQSAESTYRDTDMAKEMTQFTKNNILMQSATAMLSQANQQNQGVLQLLQ